MDNNLKKTGIALIGVGMVSKVYVDALINSRNNFYLVGVLGSKPQSAVDFLFSQKSSLFDKVKAYSTVEEIAKDSKIDFVILTTPPNARLEIVKQLVLYKKPILMEKPIERTLKAAQEICQISEESNVLIGIMFQHRARPSAEALLKKLKENNIFGTLYAVEIAVPWWRNQSYYDEPGRGTYNRDGGGVMISQAIHTLDLAIQFTGPINAVTSMTAQTAFHKMESEDFVAAGLEFENGAKGSFVASTASYPGRTEEIILHYENVSVRLQSNLLELNWQNGQQEIIGESLSSGAGADPMAFTSDWHRFMIEDFNNAIKTNQKPKASIQSSLEVHKLISMLEMSAKMKRRIETHEI